MMTINKKYKLTNAVVSKEMATKFSIEQIGGKAFQLIELTSKGYPVPDFVILPHYFLQEFLGNSDSNWSTIIDNLRSYFPDENFFAVRSSANLEDGQVHSFAGLFESVLGVQFEDLGEAITKVFNSGKSDQVKAYCREHNIDSTKIELSVIVQLLIPAEKSGVAFGAHPLTGERNGIYIEALNGFGEGLVSGKISADNYTIGKVTSENISQQDMAFQLNAKGEMGCVKMKTPRTTPALNIHQRLAVSNLLTQLQDDLGKYLDIEFSFAKNKLFLLQARPITTVGNQPDATSEYQLLWDNSNIIESYPGHTLPLTFSFISKVYAAVYKELASVFGLSKKQIEQEEQAFSLMLGLIRGRVYYNLFNWYGLLALAPGYSINAPFMEKMMGVKEKLNVQQPKMNRFRAWGRLFWSLIKMVINLFTLKNQVKRFHKFIDAYIKKAQQIDLNKLSARGLLKQYQQTEKVLVRKWQAPLLNDFFTMIFFGSLEKMCKKYFPDDPNLHNELLAGSNDIISTAPFERLLTIVNCIRQDAYLSKVFEQDNPSNIQKEIIGTKVEVLIEEYIEQFGDRTSEELKLETITYRVNPQLLIQRIKALLSSDIKNIEKSENDLRLNAETKIRLRIKNPVQRLIFFIILKKARTLVSGRENLRFERTRVFALIRSYFLALGLFWEKEGLLENRRDIFYLSTDEIKAFVFGTASISNLNELVKAQKKQYAIYKAEKAPASRCRSYDAVNQFMPLSAEPESKLTEGTLKGLGCSTGVVRAKVKVVVDPTNVEALNGEILVAHFTDPGWVTLFPGASGILVERGSLLSHSAIVSRELGLPCIVQIDGLMKSLKTGDLVEMDGSTGIIKKLNA